MADYVLYHHGIKGMRWGVRRYQNPDGTLTPAGEKRRYKIEDKLRKRFASAVLKDKGDTTHRSALMKKSEQEVENSKEGKLHSELVKKRGVLDKDGKLDGFSYEKEDWSRPEKVLELMKKDVKIHNKYIEKAAAVGKKYADEYRGATLKDLGYEDTAAGREYMRSLLNPTPLATVKLPKR